MNSPLLPFDTSTAAHQRIASTKQETCTRILRLAFERATFGITADEVAEAFHCPHNHTSPRITELVKAGLLVETGRTRLTRAGSRAQVLVHFEFAKEDAHG
ncbi:MAG: hypothetical protein WCC59_13190 [Terriglobales bacterium]